MLSIGEFSKICRVSTKTLRYYDEIGLITPDEINAENGYRYYSINQLKRMLFINRLKSYHFSLDEIKAILELEENHAEDQLYSTLHHKREQIQEKLYALEDTLMQLRSDMVNLQQSKSMLTFFDEIDVQLVETESITILYQRQLLNSDDYAAGYEKYFSSLYEQIATNKLTLSGTPITIYHSPEFNPSGNDTEFAIPVGEPVQGTRELTGELCAKSTLKGSYSMLTAVYAKLREWVEKEGYELMNSPYEVYRTDPTHAHSPEDLVTEVYFPIQKIQ
ncbi:MerR family transcriptional regulator [Ornithinibacillus xuwenensis]|uniref:MerR family transcriptional regulator n=1 Tax=Ornithinibacillus xuwenensis TaxID=3144668 RepID=A0ABU9XLH7_9BACI